MPDQNKSRIAGFKFESGDSSKYLQFADASGNIVWRYDYDAFGNEKPIAGQDPANDTNPFRYCEEYLDLSSGTYYLRNRMYNPVNGRFTSEDPIRNGLNFYTYASNNPILFIDPFGLKSTVIYSYKHENQKAAKAIAKN